MSTGKFSGKWSVVHETRFRLALYSELKSRAQRATNKRVLRSELRNRDILAKFHRPFALAYRNYRSNPPSTPLRRVNVNALRVAFCTTSSMSPDYVRYLYPNEFRHDVHLTRRAHVRRHYVFCNAIMKSQFCPFEQRDRSTFYLLFDDRTMT